MSCEKELVPRRRCRGAFRRLLSLAGCQTAAKNAVQELEAQDAVTIQLVCQSEDVYQIFYSTYLEGEEYGQGGWADMDGKALTSETSLTASFEQRLLRWKGPLHLVHGFLPLPARGTPWSLPPQSRWPSLRSTARPTPSFSPATRRAALPPSCSPNPAAVFLPGFMQNEKAVPATALERLSCCF